jgi:CHAT domain-containing protein
VDAAQLIRGDQDVIAEFLIDDEDLLVLLVARQGEEVQCRAYLSPVTRQVLAERIAHAIEPAVLRSVDDWRVAALDLLKAVPAAAWEAIAAAPHALIVPDDVLWRVPFEALPVGTGVLADRTSITYAGSAGSLLHVPAVPAATADRTSLLIVASPELPAAVRDRVRTTSPGWMLPDETSANPEVPAIVEVFSESPVTVLSGSTATEIGFRDRAGDASVLHVAAPFRMNGASPLFSPVLLTPGSANPLPDNDGVLETREVMNLELHARVAILTDGSGGSTRGAAPAADTVRWAWRAAGVPSVVFSRWPVDGADSLAVIRELYVRLEAGDPPEAALQAARAIARTGESTRAPYFWAGWMVVGR